MDLTSAKTIKELLATHNTKPSKTMGQNFLIHAPTLNKIIEAADIQATDIILEVGPGIGTLTQALAQKARKVIAIEKDRAMIEILTKTLTLHDNIEIVQGDALKTINYKLPAHYKVVANIPYYLTSALIRMFLESENPPECMVLMIQKEVAQRIAARPPHMSILAVSVQYYADAKIIAKVPKECFWPMPKVDSAIIKITPHLSSLRSVAPAGATPWQSNNISPDLFFQVVKAGFSQPRKQLGNNFSKVFDKNKINKWLFDNNINPTQRAQTLSIDDWIRLTKSL